MATKDRLNVLYIHSHDTGRYVEPYGYGVPTPRLQEFAEQSVLFRRAFCCNPTCSPSRAGLLTGQYDHQNGMFGLAHRGYRLNDPDKHLAAFLRRNGYETVTIGAQHVWPEREEVDAIGYDKRLGPSYFLDNELIAHRTAADYLHEDHEKPFFLSVGFHEIHRKYPQLEGADETRYVRPPEYIPDTPETRADMARYIKMAGELDHKMGAVFDALRESGHWDDTLVICTTDHGIAWPRMKCNLTDGGIGVMLMLRSPELPEGTVVDAMVSHLDLYPTICEVLGLEAPEWIEGRSLLPVVAGTSERVHDAVFASVNHHSETEPMRSVRTDRYKYIRRWDQSGHPVLENCNDGESKSYWVAHGWGEEPVAQEELYDLVFDPNERNNLVPDERSAGVLADMRRRLEEWMSRTDDPLLGGSIPPGPSIA